LIFGFLIIIVTVLKSKIWWQRLDNQIIDIVTYRLDENFKVPLEKTGIYPAFVLWGA
jgi:hypothetical protein